MCIVPERPDNRSARQIFAEQEEYTREHYEEKDKFARKLEINSHYLTGEKSERCKSPMFWSDQGKPDYCSLCGKEKREYTKLQEPPHSIETITKKCVECGSEYIVSKGYCARCLREHYS